MGWFTNKDAAMAARLAKRQAAREEASQYVSSMIEQSGHPGEHVMAPESKSYTERLDEQPRPGQTLASR